MFDVERLAIELAIVHINILFSFGNFVIFNLI